MPKLPWMKWYAADWLRDPQLSLCTSATRGVWSDLVSAMHLSDQTGELSGTREQLAQLARCSAVEMAQALTDLRTTGAADVKERNGTVTVINRRMSREHKKRQLDAARQDRARHRKKSRGSHDDDPQESQKSEVRESFSSLPPLKNPSVRVRDAGGSGFSKGKPDRIDLSLEVLRSRELMLRYIGEERNRGGGWLNKSQSDEDSALAVAFKVVGDFDAGKKLDPVAVAKWIFKGRRWDFVHHDHDEYVRRMRNEANRGDIAAREFLSLVTFRSVE